jgi:cytochrome c553
MPGILFPIVLPLLLAGIDSGSDSAVDFNREIRPLLVEHCLACHGPDEKARKADLRLDGLNLAALETDGGKLIVPGKPDESDLVARLVHADAAKLMPPPKFAKPLNPKQIDRLKTWIRQGAKTTAHWAFAPPQRPPVPGVKNRAWGRNAIDAFILARLEAEGLQPEPEAGRARLLRRVSLDLSGLPPTPAEVKAFESDSSPDAYERAVDRLLASPRYGERIALEWLDMARFADSNGFQVDSSRSMWPWRDWVISAYNRNLPFDQFTIEQIAGDMLPNPTQEQLIATGFQRNHRLNGEGGLIAEEWRVETVIDRVETTSLAWMGITAGCARCHDHKYDPLSQKEFYQLFALFNNVPESGTLQENRKGGNTDPAIEVATPEMLAKIKEAQGLVDAAKQKVRDEETKAASQVDAWAAGLATGLGKSVWKPLEADTLQGNGGTQYTRLADGTWLAKGPNPNHETTIAKAPISGTISAVRLVCLPDASLPNQSVGRYSNGNFVLTRMEAALFTPGSERPIPLRFSQALADYSQPGWPIEATVGQDASKGWAADGPTRRQPLEAIFKLNTPAQAPAGSTLEIRLIQATLGGHNIGRFRLAVTDAPASVVKLGEAGPSPELVAALKTPTDKRNDGQRKLLLDHYLASAPGPLGQAKSDLTKAEQALKALNDNLPTAMVMKEGPPRKAHILVRGQYDKKGEQVSPGFPTMLPPPPPGGKADRLTLARWLASPNHPLTARVWVNRAWERFFGAGLCRTTDNLGTQAEFPTHPELLDWLATEFVDRKWDMKSMVRLIVTSATYRQDSKIAPEKLKLDPQNRLLARGPRFRLPGEILRDQALFVSGLLVDKVGGPSVRPYMPTGVWDETSVYGDLRNYKNDTGDGLYRKSIYTIWKRTAAPPTMLLFDAPNRETCLVRRGRTNTPLQALALLNEITYVEAARKLGERMLAEGGNDADSRLKHGFRITLGREPSARELEILREGLTRDSQRFAQDPAGAAKLVALGEAKPKAGLPPADLAAYTLAANVLLNLDECVTRE